MNRKIQTSQGKRQFYHQNNENIHIISDNKITRPPTSGAYSTLNHYRSSTKIRNQYESNYFNVKTNCLQTHKADEFNEGRLLNRTKLHEENQDNSIPKGFKLLLNKIKILFKSAQLSQEQYKQVLKGLIIKIKQLDHEKQEIRQKYEKLQTQSDLKQSKIEELSLKIKQFSSNAKNLHNFNSSSGKDQCNKKKQFPILLQNLHLTQLNQALLKQIQSLKSSVSTGRNSHDHPKSSPQQQQSSNMEIIRFHNRINYLQMKINNAEKRQTELKQQNQGLLKKVQQAQDLARNRQQEILKLKQQKNEWKERALMQKQDSQTNVGRQNFLLFSIKKLRQANKNLTDKLLNIGSQQGKKPKDIQPNPYFQYEVDFFKSLRSVYFQAKFKQYKLSLQNEKDSFQIESMGLQQQYLQYRKHQEINLPLLSYLKPTFFSLIQQCITNDIYTCRIKGSTSVSRIFIQVLRGILNSKINQFMMAQVEDKFSRFPEFVYSWFEKYYFNSEKNEISALEPYMQKPISQDIFYRDLMNVKLDQSWEIITFRQFLLEQLNLEELYFYLMCQNLLYKKAGITDQIQYLGEFCIFVEFSAAKSVLDLVLSDFESWNISFLSSKLREKIIIKKNIEYIQSGFFLRCLIEYYKIQRINRYKYIAKLCDEFKSCEQNGLRFSSFISVINRFTEISSQEKIRLYRDCYSVSRGKITADIIFTVCTQQLIFLRYLKLKCFYKFPSIITYKDIRKTKKKTQEQSKAVTNNLNNTTNNKKQLLCLQPSDPYIYDIFIGMSKLLNDDKSFSKRINQLGVIEISHHFQTIKKLFVAERSSTSNIDSSLLKCRHFIHYMSNTLQKIREINYQNFYQLLDQNNKKRTNSSFWIEISQAELCQIFTQQFKVTFSVFEKINNYRLWKDDVYKFRVNNAARKIQRQVKKKFIEPFMQLYKIIYSELKKDDKREEK